MGTSMSNLEKRWRWNLIIYLCTYDEYGLSCLTARSRRRPTVKSRIVKESVLISYN